MGKTYSEIDNEILQYIRSCNGIPSAHTLSKDGGGPMACGHHIISERLKENPGLQKALEEKGISFVEACDRAVFDSEITSHRWVNASGRIRGAIDLRLDRHILEAIESYDGIPSVKNLSKEGKGPLEYSTKLIGDRLLKNPLLREALEEKGIAFVETCERAVFDREFISGRLKQPRKKVRIAIDRRLDSHILEAIESYNGIPNATNLSKTSGGPLAYDPVTILGRLKENPELKKALEEKGIAFVETCERAVFDREFISGRWTRATGKINAAIDRRLESHIPEAIELYDGIPNPHNLSRHNGGPLEYSATTISRYLKKNPELQKALEEKGAAYVETCDRAVFDRNITSKQWTGAIRKARVAIDKRLDRHILEAITSFDGIPAAGNLGKEGEGPLAYSLKLISHRLKKNPGLRKTLEEKGVIFVETCNRDIFDRELTSAQWTSTTGTASAAIDRRLDRHILEAITSFDGIPAAGNLGKEGEGPLAYGPEIISKRLKENPGLQQALEERGIAFVESCDRAVFDREFTSKHWISTKGNARAAIDRRLDRHILEAITSFDGIPSAKNLSNANGGPLAYSPGTISERLKENPVLRRALYSKRGLTEDRINALEIEQENPSPALIESIKRRLANTRVFREALAILRQFRELLGNRKTLEMSFYPEPLGKAADMLGIQLVHRYIKAHEVKKAGFRVEGEFDAIAMIQFCHRLTTEALANVFNEANRILVETGTVLVSLPVEYSRTAHFKTQVQYFGFEIIAEGTLYTSTLTLEELAGLGVEEPVRLKQKIEQATNLMVFVKTRPAVGKELDGFVLAKPPGGNGGFVPSMGEIDTPLYALLELSSAFQKRTAGLDEAFMLSVLADSGYDERHVVGYDMDRKTPRTVEVWSSEKPVLENPELGELSVKLLDKSFRERIFVRPGHLTRVPARIVRNALG
ncbi:MAG: hypothetical protein AB1529_03960 [Candidatus Micrarchaeota archaeon]